MGVDKLIPLAVSSARSCLSLSVAMANAGFVVAVLSMTGIGIILADNIVALSYGSLFVTLVLCMVVSIVLGMGLPTSACYIIAATIAVPILHEMKVPGLAWLELRAVAEENGSRYEQRAVFFPLGLAGRLYWLAVLPFHGFIFSGMASRIAATAEMDVEASAQPVTVTR